MSVEAEDEGTPLSGLDPSWAFYSISSDGGATWKFPSRATAMFSIGSAEREVISASDTFTRDSELQLRGSVQTLARFVIGDVRGNTVTGTFEVHIDRSPPQPPDELHSPSHQPGRVSSSNVIVAAWESGEDDSSGVSQYKVDWLRLLPSQPCPKPPTDTARLISDTRAESDPLPDGNDWYVCAWSRDEAGWYSETASKAGPFRIDTSAPGAVPGLRSTSHGTRRWTNQPATVMAWDPPVGEVVAGYAYRWDNNPVGVPTLAETTTATTVSRSLPTACQPLWYFHVAAFDEADNLGPVSHFGPLGIDQQAPPPPVITAPAAGWTNDNTPTAIWSGTDSACDSGIAEYEVAWRHSYVPGSRTTTTVTWTISPLLPDNWYYWVEVIAVDGAGNRSSVGVSPYFNIDTIAPSCSSLYPLLGTDLVQTGGGFTSLRRQFNLVAVVNEASAGSPKRVDIEVSNGATGPWSNWIQNQEIGPPFTFTGEPNGNYFFRCRGRDVAGNVGTFPSTSQALVSVVLPDLAVTGMEITQAIQDMSNSVPLVQDKQTVVRVYVQAGSTPAGTTLYRLPVDLTANCNGTPRSLGRQWVDVTPTGSQRAVLATTANFYVPPGCREGTVEFRAVINSLSQREDPNSGNDTTTRSVSFVYRYPACIQAISVRTEPETARFGDTGFWDIIRWVEAAYPVPEVRVFDTGHTVEEWEFFSYGPYEMPDDSDGVLQSIYFYDLFSDDPSGCNDEAYYYGMVSRFHGSSMGNGMGGAGVIGMDQAWGFMNIGDAGTGAAWYRPHGGSTMAHEIGHNEGREHVNCGGPEGVDSDYPYPPCDLGPNDPASYYGFDTRSWTVIPPTAVGDLMSYAHVIPTPKPRWPSDYTYKALFDELPGTEAARAKPAAPPALAEAEKVLVVVGSADTVSGTAQFQSVYLLPQGTLPPSKVTKATALQAPSAITDTWYLRLLDNNGAALGEQPFQLVQPSDSDGQRRLFFVVTPYITATARIAAGPSGGEIVSRTISPQVPTVSVLTPNGGEVISDTVTVRWSAGDEDGDTLLYMVQYSADQGATWRALATNYVSQTLTIDTAALPGTSGQALIRVIASDGVNTAIDQSDLPFTVLGHRPQVFIVEPENERSVTSQRPLVIIGRAIDAEEGELTGSALVWTSDRDGTLGTGAELVVEGLSYGWHTVTLTASDGDGAQGSQSIRINVLPDRYLTMLPIVQKAGGG